MLVRTEEVAIVRKTSNNNSRESVRSFAQDIGVSTSTAWKICRDNIFLFKIDLSQPLPENGIARRYAFVK
jgi:hypothetical protein